MLLYLGALSWVLSHSYWTPIRFVPNPDERGMCLYSYISQSGATGQPSETLGRLIPLRCLRTLLVKNTDAHSVQPVHSKLMRWVCPLEVGIWVTSQIIYRSNRSYVSAHSDGEVMLSSPSTLFACFVVLSSLKSRFSSFVSLKENWGILATNGYDNIEGGNFMLIYLVDLLFSTFTQAEKNNIKMYTFM